MASPVNASSTSSPAPPSIAVSTTPSPIAYTRSESATAHLASPPRKSSTKRAQSPSTPLRTASQSSRNRPLSPAAASHSLSALGHPPSPSSTSSALGARGSMPLSPPKPPPPPASASPTSTPLAPPLLAGSAIRPSPVVPPSPSVPPTPSFSRPTSPQPSSPTRTRTASGGGGLMISSIEGSGGREGKSEASGVSRSGSQVDLSHIFERDVEFAPSHLLNPSEAVDVAVPPVLTEAAVALTTLPCLLSSSDLLAQQQDLAALVHDAEQEAQAGSGWSSPVVPPQLALHQPHVTSPLHHHSHANASRSPVRGSGMRSFSPDSTGRGGVEGARSLSPDSSTTFSVGTPPTSNSGGSPPPMMPKSGSPPPALSLGPFGQRLAEALENEANKPAAPQGSSSLPVAKRDTSPDAVEPSRSAASSPGVSRSAAAKTATYTPLKPSLLLPFPSGTPAASGPLDDPFSSFSPASSSASPLHSPSYEHANPFAAPSPSSTIAGGAASSQLAQPHPRRLSFYSYADLINEERIQELKGEAMGSGLGEGPGGLGVGVREAGSRTVSGASQQTRREAVGGMGLAEVEGKLAGVALDG
ncbi:hypothetical protein JCM11641_005805 [Rhodosporidiobolus odoratus]